MVQIYWSSKFADGSFYVTLTEKQLILFSGSDNPSPGRIYFVADITNRYQKIKSFLQRFRSPFIRGDESYYEFIPVIAERQVEDSIKYKQWEFALVANFSFLIQTLNSALDASDTIIPPLSSEELTPMIRIGC